MKTGPCEEASEPLPTADSGGMGIMIDRLRLGLRRCRPGDLTLPAGAPWCCAAAARAGDAPVDNGDDISAAAAAIAAAEGFGCFSDCWDGCKPAQGAGIQTVKFAPPARAPAVIILC